MSKKDFEVGDLVALKHSDFTLVVTQIRYQNPKRYDCVYKTVLRELKEIVLCGDALTFIKDSDDT